MRTAMSPAPSDPEFDRVTHELPGPPTHVLKYYQLLVVNPFLALVVVACCLWLDHYLLDTQSDRNRLLIGFFFFGLCCMVIQYHCLDCGATGMFFGRERHQCPRIRKRWHDRQMISPYYPHASAQFVLWLFAIGVAALALSTYLRE